MGMSGVMGRGRGKHSEGAAEPSRIILKLEVVEGLMHSDAMVEKSDGITSACGDLGMVAPMGMGRGRSKSLRMKVEVSGVEVGVSGVPAS